MTMEAKIEYKPAADSSDLDTALSILRDTKFDSPKYRELLTEKATFADRIANGIAFLLSTEDGIEENDYIYLIQNAQFADIIAIGLNALQLTKLDKLYNRKLLSKNAQYSLSIAYILIFTLQVKAIIPHDFYWLLIINAQHALDIAMCLSLLQDKQAADLNIISKLINQGANAKQIAELMILLKKSNIARTPNLNTIISCLEKKNTILKHLGTPTRLISQGEFNKISKNMWYESKKIFNLANILKKLNIDIQNTGFLLYLHTMELYVILKILPTKFATTPYIELILEKEAFIEGIKYGLQLLGNRITEDDFIILTKHAEHACAVADLLNLLLDYKHLKTPNNIELFIINFQYAGNIYQGLKILHSSEQTISTADYEHITNHAKYAKLIAAGLNNYRNKTAKPEDRGYLAKFPAYTPGISLVLSFLRSQRLGSIKNIGLLMENAKYAIHIYIIFSLMDLELLDSDDISSKFTLLCTFAQDTQCIAAVLQQLKSSSTAAKIDLNRLIHYREYYDEILESLAAIPDVVTLNKFSQIIQDITTRDEKRKLTFLTAIHRKTENEIEINHLNTLFYNKFDKYPGLTKKILDFLPRTLECK